MAEVVIDVVGKDSFSGVLGNLGSIMTGIESTINLVGRAFDFLRDQAMAGLEAVASYERMTVALTSLGAAQMVMAGTAASVSDAWGTASVQAELLAQWMQELAIKSPFTLEGVAQAFRLAMAYGFSADEAQRLTQALINFSAGTGATEYNMQLIARALGQISTAGKLTGQDMMQLTSAGLPVAQILAEAFGVTTEEIIRMRSEGLLPAQEVIEAITVWIETNFGGAAERFATSWAGIFSTLDDLRQMGLRELFMGIAEAIQPFINVFVTLAQELLIPALGSIGDALGGLLEPFRLFFDHVVKLQELNPELSILHALGLALRDLWEVSPVFYDLGVGLLNFSNMLETGLTPLQAFEVAAFRLSQSNGPLAQLGSVLFGAITVFREQGWQEGLASLTTGLLDLAEMQFEGTPFGNFIDTLQTFIADFQTGGFGVAVGNLFESFGNNFNIEGQIQSLVDMFTQAIGRANWTGVGETLGVVVGTIIQTAFEGLHIIVARVDWGPLGRALLDALGEMWEGVISDPELWASSDEAVKNAIGTLLKTIMDLLADIFIGIVDLFILKPEEKRRLNEEYANAGRAIVDGFVDGMWAFELSVTDWVREKIVNPIKRFLGIASPSTLFMQIGRDVVQGLIDGITSMFPNLTSVVSTLFNLLAGGNGSGSGGGTGGASATFAGFGSGTITGYSPGGGLASTTLSAASVVNNFYAPVYFGDMSQLGYDCPSPHPLLAATAGGVGGR